MKRTAPGLYTETYRDTEIIATRITEGRDFGWWTYTLPAIFDDSAFGPWRTLKQAFGDARRSLDHLLRDREAESPVTITVTLRVTMPRAGLAAWAHREGMTATAARRDIAQYILNTVQQLPMLEDADAVVSLKN